MFSRDRNLKVRNDSRYFSWFKDRDVTA